MIKQDTPILLAVDDESNVLNALTRCFLESRFTVLTALHASEALSTLEKHGGAAVVISDYRMPGMNGVDFLQQVMKRWPLAKRVILSAYPDTDVLLSAVNEGRVHRFLTKPWRNDALRAVIEELLDESDALETVRIEVEELVRRNKLLSATNRQLADLLDSLLKTVRDEPAPASGIMRADTADDSRTLASLSAREREIFEKLAQGKQIKEIAHELGLSIKTVSTYKTRMFEKMKFRNIAELVAHAINRLSG